MRKLREKERMWFRNMERKKEQAERYYMENVHSAFEEELALVFLWWKNKFPKRKYDLRWISSGNGVLGGWDINNFSTSFCKDPYYDWQDTVHNTWADIDKPMVQLPRPVDRIAAVLKPLWDLYMTHYYFHDDIADYDVNRDMFWYENEWLRERPRWEENNIKLL